VARLKASDRCLNCANDHITAADPNPLHLKLIMLVAKQNFRTK